MWLAAELRALRLWFAAEFSNELPEDDEAVAAEVEGEE